MRTLSAKIGINEETFAPELELLLDGEDTGVRMAVELTQDMSTMHGPEAVQVLVDSTVHELNQTHSLTEEEIEHYRAKFVGLINPNTEEN